MQFYASAFASVSCYTYCNFCCASSVSSVFNHPLMHAWWGRSTNVGLHVNAATPGSRGAVIGCTLPSVAKTQGNAPRPGGASGVLMPMPPPRCVISTSRTHYTLRVESRNLSHCSVIVAIQSALSCPTLPCISFKNPNPKLWDHQPPLATLSPQAPSKHLHQILVRASTVTSTSTSCHCCPPSSAAVPLVRPLRPN